MRKSIRTKIGIYVLAVILGTEAWGNANVAYANENREETKALATGEVNSGENIYIVQEGDCLWSIALAFYGDGRFWEELYEINKEVIGDNPGFLLVGTELGLSQTAEASISAEIKSVEGGKELQDKKWLVYWKENKAYYVKDMDHSEQAVYLGELLDEKMETDIKLSEDGRYLYYGGRWSEEKLYRMNLEELWRNRSRAEEIWELIDGDVSWYKPVEDGSNVVYENSEGTLFYFNGKESKLIAKNVSSYQVVEDRVNYLLEGQEEIFFANAFLFEEEEKMYYDNFKSELLKREKEIEKIYEIGDKQAIFYTKPGRQEDTCDLYYYEEGKESLLLAAGITEGNVVWDTELSIIFFMKEDKTVCYSTDGTVQELGVEPGSLLLDWQGNGENNLLMLGYMPKEAYEQYEEVERGEEPQTYTANHRRLVSYALQDGKLIPKEQISTAYYRGCWYGDLYYYTECVEEYDTSIFGEEYRVELWCYQNGTKCKISQEGPLDSIAIYEDGGVVAWQWKWKETGVREDRKMWIMHGVEGAALVAEDSDSVYYINKNRVLYIVDEDLYVYTKEQGSRLIAEDVGKYHYYGPGAYINRNYSIL